MIEVLLATYQPDERLLREQVESITRQRGVEVTVRRREDAAHEGACANFGHLLEASQAEYVAFADQDDVWLPDKLAKCMQKMQELEQRWGRESPLLVFSDARVVDADLNVLSESLFRRIRVNPHRNLPNQLVMQNTGYGNTMLINAALRRRIVPIPDDAVMHDHWTMLVASVFGHIGYVNEPLLLYRQHTRNVFGGVDVGLRYFWRKICQGRRVLRQRLYGNVRQAAAFAERFGGEAPHAFHALAGWERKFYLVRVWTLVRCRIFKNGIIRNIGMFAIA